MIRHFIFMSAFHLIEVDFISLPSFSPFHSAIYATSFFISYAIITPFFVIILSHYRIAQATPHYAQLLLDIFGHQPLLYHFCLIRLFSLYHTAPHVDATIITLPVIYATDVTYFSFTRLPCFLPSYAFTRSSILLPSSYIMPPLRSKSLMNTGLIFYAPSPSESFR